MSKEDTTKNQVAGDPRADVVIKLAETLEMILKDQDEYMATKVLNHLTSALRLSGIELPNMIHTPYVNTIPPEQEPEYPGDRDVERSIKSITRWNAMAMVVNANSVHDGLGGHISTYASAATLYDVGYNHFFRGPSPDRPADQVYFQGHASPGVYARAYVEGLLDINDLTHYRQELGDRPGLSSYPHPYLMPHFWQFPTVSMGLGPLSAIYQARFNRYLQARGLVSYTEEPRVWCFIGDGETDEVETLGALSLAARENLDNLTFVINCNLQRLDGPVRGNGKIIQEMEGVFNGHGWNVIKVIWGEEWDELLQKDHKGLLVKRMQEAVDGDYQKYSVEPGSYSRTHFFGTNDELKEMVNHLTDKQIRRLTRGGHDPLKVYTAYQAATECKGKPTVILAKTVKGYGLGEAGEGRNISHQQKKLNEKELRQFKDRFGIPISDEDVVKMPFYRPAEDSPEIKYIKKIRQRLGRFLPERQSKAPPLDLPEDDLYVEFDKGSGEREVSTTMAFVRILTKLLRDKKLGKHLVPIIPDEARTFGMETLFRQFSIYAANGQKYEPVDKESISYYREEKNGQILEEGINEAGAMSSFIAAGTSYSTHGTYMVPFYVYYSMFGFQRVGDLMWQAADQRSKGFVLGATAGRTALNGEGLQHQDGHSHLLASTIPTIRSYDPAYAYEIAVIIKHGLNEMYVEGMDGYYYLTLHNDNYQMIQKPKGCDEGIIQGLYKLKAGPSGKKYKAHLFGSGAILNQLFQAQKILAKDYQVSADIWSATSYRRLRHDALNCQRWNMLHPKDDPKESYLEKLLKKEKGVFVAASDNMRIVPEQITSWVPGGLLALGTDGFGRSDTRERLRRFFEVDAESAVLAVLYSLVHKAGMKASILPQAISDLEIDAEKSFPFFSITGSTIFRFI